MGQSINLAVHPSSPPRDVIKLHLEAFDKDRNQVIDRAISVGVNHFFIPAISSKYFKRMLDLKEQYPKKIHLMAGLHPCYVKEDFNEELNLLNSHSSLYLINISEPTRPEWI